VAVTGYPNDLVELHGTSECPVLVLIKPVRLQQIDEALSLVGAGSLSRRTRAPVLIANDDAAVRRSLRRICGGAGHEVREAASGEEALEALSESHFGHVFFDLAMPGAGAGLAAEISEANPGTTVVISRAAPEEMALLRQPCALLPDPSDEGQVLAALTLHKDPAR
jgi:CheY-like chemotaxis protein